MAKLLIIADDFTGALDTAVQFAAYGEDIRVLTGPDADLAAVCGCQVLVVDAETRHLPPQRAYQAVAHIVEQAVALSVPHIYKKTDSALRGNIGAELTALLDVSGQRQLPFLPAFPQIGRVTQGGIQYIGGTPVANSVFGQDPFEPVQHSTVASLIAAQSQVPIHNCPLLTENGPFPDEEGITVFDAATTEDLERIGRRLLERGRLHIMAGCAGFGAVLPELLGLTGHPHTGLPRLDPRLLVICGSVNPITTAQLDRAEAEGFLRIRLTPEQKLDTDYWLTPQGAAEFDIMGRLLEKYPYRIIETNDAGGNQPTAEYAAARGMTTDDVRLSISQSVGYMVSRLFPSPALGTLLVTGGDTLLQCMDYMGVHELQPLYEMESGVVLSRFTYQGYTRYIISKSGGFGEAGLIPSIAAKLAQTQGNDPLKEVYSYAESL